jgi:hypothetical protein
MIHASPAFSDPPRTTPGKASRANVETPFSRSRFEEQE